MDILQVLMWIVCVVISANSSSDSQLGHRYFNVWKNYKNLQDQMMNFKMETNLEFIRLANRTFLKLDEHENERLKKDYSPCLYSWMRILREDIGSLMIEKYPEPCSQLLFRIWDDIEAQITEEITEIGVVIDRIDKCMNNSRNNCTSNNEVSKLHAQASRLRIKWFQYKKYKLVPKWRKMIGCFANLSAAIENKLVDLSKNSSRCASGTHEQLFQELGLQPLSIHRLIGSAMDWFKVDEPPSPSSQNVSKYQEKSQIMQTLNSLKVDIKRYVQRHVIFGMTIVIDESMDDVRELLKFLSNPKSLPEENRLCYQERLQTMEDSIKNRYENYLAHICFYGLLDVRNEFINIVQCDLEVLKERLSEVRYCWADEGICQKISSRLKKFENSLHTWEQFSLTPTMQGASKCYEEATQLIIQSVHNSVASLRKCENFPLPYIYDNLTKNVQPYPPYESAELCFVQPEDMDY